MKYKWIYSNKNIIKFIISLALIALIVGILIYLNQPKEVHTGIINKLNELTNNIKSSRQNNILFHLSILSILVLLSLIVIGIPLGIFYYFYEFVSLGYLLASLFKYKGLNGLLFGSIFIITNKMLFLIVLSYFLLSMINYTRNYIKYFKNNKKDLIIRYLYKGLFILVTIFINDIILYFIGNKILSLFIFLL